jgi:hypothetical protein
MVAGPVLLLHANFNRRVQTQFFRVERRDGLAADCSAGSPLGWDGESTLEVGKDELVCVSAARNTGVAWHARTVVVDASKTMVHASLP